MATSFMMMGLVIIILILEREEAGAEGEGGFLRWILRASGFVGVGQIQMGGSAFLLATMQESHALPKTLDGRIPRRAGIRRIPVRDDRIGELGASRRGDFPLSGWTDAAADGALGDQARPLLAGIIVAIVSRCGGPLRCWPTTAIGLKSLGAHRPKEGLWCQ
jgi:hypothetical protein